MEIKRKTTFTIELSEDELKYLTIVYGNLSQIQRSKFFDEGRLQDVNTYGMTKELFEHLNREEDFYTVFNEALNWGE